MGIVPASDTGAYEMAMWNLLGERPVDACYWESFGKGWKEDALKHLGLKNTRDFTADYGQVCSQAYRCLPLSPLCPLRPRYFRSFLS